MNKVVFYAVISLFFVSPVWAMTVPWDPGAPGTTHQMWNFDTDANPALPDDGGTGNPYGDPVAEISGSVFDPDLAWQDGVWSGSVVKITIDLPNSRLPNEYKDVYVEMAFQGLLNLSWVANDAMENFENTYHNVEVQGDWIIVSDIWHIEPNPLSETLCYGFAGVDLDMAALDYVIIDTICIPEPFSIGLLALGGIFVARQKRG